MEATQPTPEPSIADVAPSWAYQQYDRLRRGFLNATLGWIVLMFAALVLTVLNLPYPLTLAMLLIIYDLRRDQTTADERRRVEEGLAWSIHSALAPVMRRLNQMSEPPQ